MALELGEYNIRVNTIAPGLFRAEMTEDIYRKSSKILKSVVEKTVLLTRLGNLIQHSHLLFAI